MPIRKKSAKKLSRRRAGFIAAAVTATVLLFWRLNQVPYNVVFDGEKVYLAPVTTMTAMGTTTTSAVDQPPVSTDAPAEATRTADPGAVDPAWVLSRCEEDLCVTEPGQVARRLGIHPGLTAVWAPNWSPDGRHFIFEACPSDEDNDELCAWNAYRVNRDGSGVEMLIAGARYPTYSPDGQWIAFHRNAVMAVSSDLADWRVIADMGSDEVHFPTWSPDSRQVAWIGGRLPEGGWSTVYVANLDGSGYHAVYENPHQGNRPVWSEMAWSPDGQALVFYLERGAVMKVDAACDVRESSCGQSIAELAAFPEPWTARYWPQWAGERVKAAAFPTGAQAVAARDFAMPILDALAGRPPDFEDEFNDASAGWTWDERLIGQVQVSDGALKVDGPGEHGIFPPQDLLRSRNFVLEFDARLETDGGIGVLFRQQRTELSYMFFVHYPDNSWRVHNSLEDRGIAEGGGNVRLPGETNRVRIVAHENRYAVFINSQPSGYFEDSSILEAGNLMLSFHGPAGGTPARGNFDNFKFWDLDRVPDFPWAPGPVLLEEDFEDGQADSLRSLDGNWQVIADETGNLVLAGDNTSSPDEGLGAAFGSMDWLDFAVTYRLRILNVGGDAWLNFRSAGSYYVQRFSVNFKHLGLYYRPPGGVWEPLQEPNFGAQRNVWYLIRVEALGQVIRIYVDDKLAIEQSGAHTSPGELVLGALPGTRLQIDDIRVTELAAGSDQ